jgi:hypothetical protein
MWKWGRVEGTNITIFDAELAESQSTAGEVRGPMGTVADLLVSSADHTDNEGY